MGELQAVEEAQKQTITTLESQVGRLEAATSEELERRMEEVSRVMEESRRRDEGATVTRP